MLGIEKECQYCVVPPSLPLVEFPIPSLTIITIVVCHCCIPPLPLAHTQHILHFNYKLQRRALLHHHPSPSLFPLLLLLSSQRIEMIGKLTRIVQRANVLTASGWSHLLAASSSSCSTAAARGWNVEFESSRPTLLYSKGVGVGGGGGSICFRADGSSLR